MALICGIIKEYFLKLLSKDFIFITYVTDFHV